MKWLILLLKQFACDHSCEFLRNIYGDEIIGRGPERLCLQARLARRGEKAVTAQQMTIKSTFAWYDLRVGFYWDCINRKLYFFPIPCLGLVVRFKQQSPLELCGELPDLRCK